ncbi:MAG: hypothetical protein J0665_07085 [Deltaproteobacteria bacterium]|jgi:hypothetical protein|nr:hypothetical protein [Deltaproteobacteria bacterium]
MDTSSISGSSLLMATGQSRQTLSTTMMKQAADQQNEMADLLAQNSKQAPQPATTRDSSFSFSTYA